MAELWCANALNSSPSSSCEAVLGADGEKGGGSQELATNHRGDDHPAKELHVGVTCSSPLSVGSAQEKQGARGLYTASPGSTMRG